MVGCYCGVMWSLTVRWCGWVLLWCHVVIDSVLVWLGVTVVSLWSLTVRWCGWVLLWCHVVIHSALVWLGVNVWLLWMCGVVWSFTVRWCGWVLTCGCYDCVVPESEGEDAVAVVVHQLPAGGVH